MTQPLNLPECSVCGHHGEDHTFEAMANEPIRCSKCPDTVCGSAWTHLGDALDGGGHVFIGRVRCCEDHSGWCWHLANLCCTACPDRPPSMRGYQGRHRADEPERAHSSSGERTRTEPQTGSVFDAKCPYDLQCVTVCRMPQHCPGPR